MRRRDIMTGAERKAAGMISVEHGWIILREGTRFEDQLYPTEQAASTTARCFPGSTVATARRVRTIYRKRPEWIIGETA